MPAVHRRRRRASWGAASNLVTAASRAGAGEEAGEEAADAADDASAPEAVAVEGVSNERPLKKPAGTPVKTQRSGDTLTIPKEAAKVGDPQVSCHTEANV